MSVTVHLLRETDTLKVLFIKTKLRTWRHAFTCASTAFLGIGDTIMNENTHSLFYSRQADRCPSRVKYETTTGDVEGMVDVTNKEI